MSGFNQIGRKIYYLNTTGEVLYDTGEAEGFVMQSTYEQDIENGWMQDVPKDKIGVIQLKYGEYKDYFGNYNFFKINLVNKKLWFYNKEIYRMQLYNDQKVKKEYTEEKIYEFYNTYLDYNIKRALQVGQVKFNWKTVNELNIRTRILDRSWVTYFKDDYLSESARDKTRLGLDILENGTYWPVVTGVDPIDGKLYVYEGNHRVISAKLAMIDGKWPADKKILCMEVLGDYDSFKETDRQISLEKPMRQRYPFAGVYDSLAYEDEEAMNGVHSRMNDEDAVFVDKDHEIVEREIYTYTEFMHANQVFPHWLRDIFYKFRQENGRIIKPHRVLNDEREWNEWVASNKAGDSAV